MTRTKAQKQKRQAARAMNRNDNLKGSLARTRRADAPSIAPNITSGSLRRINNRLSWPADDSTTIRVRSTSTITSDSSTGKLSFALDPTAIATTNYGSLGSTNALILAMSTAYSRFMVTQSMFKITLTTPITNGGFVGLGYTPDNTHVSGPPPNIRDATSAAHSDISQVGESAVISFDASQYFIDWRPTLTSGAAAPDNQCGVVQIYFDGGSTTISSVLFEMDVVVHFAGFRYNT